MRKFLRSAAVLAVLSVAQSASADSVTLNGHTYSPDDFKGYGYTKIFPTPILPDMLTEISNLMAGGGGGGTTVQSYSCGTGYHASAFDAATGATTCTADATTGGSTDSNALHVGTAGEIAGITTKAMPTTSDLLVIEDSAASNAKKKVTAGSLPISSAVQTALNAKQNTLTAGTDYLQPNGSAASLTNFPTLNQSTTGNAGTATKLQTARTINGVSFDGTANITVSDSTKEPIMTAGSTSQYLRGDKTWQAKDWLTGLTGDVTTSGSGNASTTLANTTVTAGSYTNANITVDSKGRITAAANGTGGTASVTASSAYPSTDDTKGATAAYVAAGFADYGVPTTGNGSYAVSSTTASGSGLQTMTSGNLGPATYTDVVAKFGSGTCSGALLSGGACAVLAQSVSCAAGQHVSIYNPATGAFTCSADSASGTIDGSTGSTDNAILIANGAGGSTIKAATPTIDPASGALNIPHLAGVPDAVGLFTDNGKFAGWGAPSGTLAGSYVLGLPNPAPTTGQVLVVSGAPSTVSAYGDAATSSIPTAATYLSSGAYTPTLTAGTNVSTITHVYAQYMRIDNRVRVEGQAVLVSSATANAFDFTVSLPFASTLSANAHLSGAANWFANLYSNGDVSGNTTTAKVSLYLGSSVSTGGTTIKYSFTYLVE